MSGLSDLLKDRLPDGWSAREVGRRAEALGYDFSQATATAYFGGRHGSHPSPQTLEALAAVLPVTVEEMRAALGLTPDPGEPWEPPEVSRRLTPGQRLALSRLIHEMVPKEGDRDGWQPKGQKIAADGGADSSSENGGRQTLSRQRPRGITGHGRPPEGYRDE